MVDLQRSIFVFLSCLFPFLGFAQTFDLNSQMNSHDLAARKVKSRTVYVYAYEGDIPTKVAKKESRQIFNKNGKVTTLEFEQGNENNPITKVQYQYDPQGCLTRKLVHSYQDSVLSRVVYSCDSLSRNTGYHQYNPKGELETQVHWVWEGKSIKYEVVMGADGDTIKTYRFEPIVDSEAKTYLSDHPQDFRLLTHQKNNSEGKPIQKVQQSESGTILNRESWEYDDAGKVVIYLQMDAENGLEKKWYLQYNSRGLPELAQYLENSIPVRVERYLYEYH